MTEMVNHPKHYQQAGRKECIVEMEDKYGGEVTAIFCLTNAYKYLYRAGDKEGNPEEQDKKKAQWYFDYAKKMIDKYGILFMNRIRVQDSDLYADIEKMLR